MDTYSYIQEFGPDSLIFSRFSWDEIECYITSLIGIGDDNIVYSLGTSAFEPLLVPFVLKIPLWQPGTQEHTRYVENYRSLIRRHRLNINTIIDKLLAKLRWISYPRTSEVSLAGLSPMGLPIGVDELEDNSPAFVQDRAQVEALLVNYHDSVSNPKTLIPSYNAEINRVEKYGICSNCKRALLRREVFCTMCGAFLKEKEI